MPRPIDACLCVGRCNGTLEYRAFGSTRCAPGGAGAGAVTRHAASTPVFGCTIAASQFGVFLIPLLYITAEHLRGRSQKTQKTK